MKSPVTFRRYVKDDLDQVLELCVAEDWPTYPADPFRAHSAFTAPGVVSVVADSNGHVVGFAYCQSDGAIQAHLSLLVVASTRRREGIAGGLLEFLFRQLDVIRMDLITDAAQDFYRSLPHRAKPGFRIYPRND